MKREQVIERISLGRMVEAEASMQLDGRRTFVEVRPLIDEKVATLTNVDVGIEPTLSRLHPNADVIKEYRVRFCTLNPGWETYPDDWDHFVHEQGWAAYGSLEELEQSLSERFGILFDDLQVPGRTESPL